MAEQPKTDAASLSLVDTHNQAVAFDSPVTDVNQTEALLERLPSILQTTLELDDLIDLFQGEIKKALPYDSFHYQHRDVMCDINSAKRSHHKCTYRLEMNTVWLGELTLTRGKKFSDQDTQLVEEFLCKLIYPLRNCLLYRQAQRAALQDKLTGLNNRAAFDNSLTREVDLAQRQHTPLSLVVLDIDHFKAVNDTYGHSAGDSALQLLSESIIQTLRRSDIAFRYGGEEFALILSNTDKDAAEVVAERIREAVAQLSCNEGHRSFSFTISLGLTTLSEGEHLTTFFDRADKALYEAKHSGRNKTVAI